MYEPIFDLSAEKKADTTQYRFLGKEGVSLEKVKVGSIEKEFLTVDAQAIQKLTEVAIDDVSHLLRSSHLEKLSKIH